MKKSLIIELILFIVLMSILTFLGVKIFKNTFDIGTTYHLKFQDINGIVIGSPVKILGVDIGHVTKIKTEYDKIHIDFIVTDNKIKIPEGTHATVASFGIAGSRSIELTPPSADNDESGLIVDEPIRLGDAFAISAKFLKATMLSIGGLYEFAKNRTQDNVQNITTNAVLSTKATSNNLSNITATIERGGTTTRNNLNNTTKGMTRIYNEASVFNFSQTVNISKYVIHITRKSLTQFHSDIRNFNKESDYYAAFANTSCLAIKNAEGQIKNISGIYNTANEINTILDRVNQKFTCETINQIYRDMNDIKDKTKDLPNKI